jgi:hypothetical protein
MGRKVERAMQSLGKKCLMDTRKEHNKLARAQPDYKGDIKWKGSDGEEQSTTRGPVDTDDAGDKR